MQTWLRRGFAMFILLTSIPVGRWPLLASLPPGTTLADCAALAEPLARYPRASHVRCIRTADGLVMVDAFLTEDSPTTIRAVYNATLNPDWDTVQDAADGSLRLRMPVRCERTCSYQLFTIHMHRSWFGTTLVTLRDHGLDRIRINSDDM